MHRSSRTPLMAALRRAFRSARLSEEGLESADRAAAQGALSRREFVVGALALGVTAALPGCRKTSSGENAAPQGSKDDIAIVGAGIAGLAAAHRLAKAGKRAQIYEAGMRAGGRIYTLRDVVAPGTWTEAGGEFIDSAHEDMMALAKEFGLVLEDMRGGEYGKLKEFAFRFGGRHRSEKEVVAEARAAARLLKADMDSLPEAVRAGTTGPAAALDGMSLEEYLAKRGVTGWFGDLLRVAYVTEFGLDAGSQSSLNLLTMVSFDLKEDRFAIFGASDERYRIQGGNQGVTDALAAKYADALRFDHRLEAIAEAPAGGYVLTFRSGGKSVERRCGAAVLALPFTLLRSVDIRAALPPVKRKAIAELGYGTNSKLFAGFSSRPWRDAGFSGYFFTDGALQSGWDHTLTQKGPAAGLTIFQGGAAGLALAKESPKDTLTAFAPALEALYPGARASLNGAAAGFHWPAHPLSLGSYACYKPGQWTSIAGEEAQPAGDLYFAGEHCSTDFQGYMNGGALTGRQAAEAILEKMGKRAPQSRVGAVFARSATA